LTSQTDRAVFLGQDNSVKLGDFGLSKILQSHDFASTYVGTPFYMSPEICKAEQYGPHSDIWALGCIMYEMCAKTPPFNAKTHFELIQKIKMGRYPEIPSVYTPELKKVIASCLQVVPNHRPDTAALLNLPYVKVCRKEQEVVELNQKWERKMVEVRLLEERLLRTNEEAQRRLAEVERRGKDLDAQLRREWEVKAHLEIDRQVKQLEALKMAELQAQYDEAVNKRVEDALAKYPNRLSTSPRLAPRSETPTMPAEPQQDLFPADSTTAPVITNSSMASTVGTDSSFASGTDLSSLSLDDSTSQEEPTVQQKPVPAKRSRRAPLMRAQTMFTANAHPPPSPMDVQMGEPSPAPASIAGLSLSPRRNAQRQNIFAAAKDGAKKWEPLEIPPPSPTEDDWTRDLDDDDLPVLPSPTRARSASGSRPGSGNEDPFKVLAAQRPILKPNQRLASAPTLAPNGTKPRPASAVPIVATSPSRPQKTKSVDLSASPTRKTAATGPGLVSKKRVGAVGNDRLQALRGPGGVQGRTLVELQQARGIPMQTMSDNEDAGKKRNGFRSPVKARSANEPAIWDPEVELEMPSPFIVRSKRMVK
jgi:NIMA (never in mitosis gene a)-related kinase